MPSVALAPLALLLLLGQSTAPVGGPVRPSPPADLRWEDADHLAATVARLERRLKAGKPASREPIVVTEREINSYVALTLAPQIPPALSSLRFRLAQGRLEASGMLDLDAVRSKLPKSGPSSLLAFLSGTVPVELKGRFQGSAGLGQVEVEEALVSGIGLPPALLAEIVAQATRSAQRPEGFNLLAPVPLPWTVQAIRLEPGRAVVEFLQP
jgi:hypothetical protein